MIKLAPDFDAEKRRRWYAFLLGAFSSASLVLIFLMTEGIGQVTEPLWEIGLVLFAMWFFFFILKYAAAYALWYKPYASRFRAISLSLLAVLAVYSSLLGVNIMYVALKAPSVGFINALKSFWQFHKTTYGLPYLMAAAIGWCFAGSAPDVREAF